MGITERSGEGASINTNQQSVMDYGQALAPTSIAPETTFVHESQHTSLNYDDESRLANPDSVLYRKDELTLTETVNTIRRLNTEHDHTTATLAVRNGDIATEPQISIGNEEAFLANSDQVSVLQISNDARATVDDTRSTPSVNIEGNLTIHRGQASISTRIACQIGSGEASALQEPDDRNGHSHYAMEYMETSASEHPSRLGMNGKSLILADVNHVHSRTNSDRGVALVDSDVANSADGVLDPAKANPPSVVDHVQGSVLAGNDTTMKISIQPASEDQGLEETRIQAPAVAESSESNALAQRPFRSMCRCGCRNVKRGGKAPYNLRDPHKNIVNSAPLLSVCPALKSDVSITDL
jgi:hypothetical protein